MTKRDPKTGRFLPRSPESKTAKPTAPKKEKVQKVQSEQKEEFTKTLEMPLDVFAKKDMSGNPVKMKSGATVKIVKTEQLHDGQPICRVKRETSSRTFYTTEDQV